MTMIRKTRLLAVAMVLAATGCSLNSAEKRYMLAEQLWTNGEYQSAVSEFDKVYRRGMATELGLKALFRMAMTRTLFLNEHQAAIEDFNTYIERAKDPESIWMARREIGEILFSRLNRYSEAVKHYEHFVRLPDPWVEEDLPVFLFRIGRSYFFLNKFEQAKDAYSEILVNYPKAPIAEQASFQLGETLYTSGEQALDESSPEHTAYKKAIHAYKAFLNVYPHSSLAPQARFGIAMALEEMDELEKAYDLFAQLEERFPSPNVVKIRMARIKERLDQRKKPK